MLTGLFQNVEVFFICEDLNLFLWWKSLIDQTIGQFAFKAVSISCSIFNGLGKYLWVKKCLPSLERLSASWGEISMATKYKIIKHSFTRSFLIKL